jgi:uncharacterized protein
MEVATMPPWDATGFEWDEHNEDHLAKHGIMPWEAEEVFLNDPVWVPDTRHGHDRFKMVGRTAGGRALTVVVQIKDGGATVRPFTSWECTQGERTRYLRQRRETR